MQTLPKVPTVRTYSYMPISRQKLFESAAELIMHSDKILITITTQDASTASEAIEACICIAKKMRLGYYLLIENDQNDIQYFELGEPIDLASGKIGNKNLDNGIDIFYNWISKPGALIIINLSAVSKDSKMNIILRKTKSPKINLYLENTPRISTDAINIKTLPLASALEIKSILKSNGWLSD